MKFLQSIISEKYTKHGDKITARYRSIYVMKKEYLGDVVRRITNSLPAYHMFIGKSKKEEYGTTGNARKSLGPEDSVTRARLLQSHDR
ncbi:hypothetical protein EC973_000858 [Apophysomyces ossiformis]|uniref:Uncharacterized protein n=1 Tax=Apophysomyces ossiformis TaxID=679940 RepID=A0A8H7BKC8_9FUNG|nr:hypothetical protein EC973_000858 [Apophysomyces ossiformis]